MKKLAGVLFALSLALAGCQLGASGGAVPPDSAEISTRSGVTYEIYVASFHDSDGDQVGDLNGIKEKLPYLQKLGVEYLWLMPIHPSHSYHKYDVDDYMKIDPAYGTMDDFRALIRAAKAKGIKIIMDMVINHSSSNHPWFKKALAEAKAGKLDGYASYYNFGEKPIRKSTKIGSNLYYESAFTENMPDLNLDNPKVREELTKIAKFYLNMGVAGFRLDAALHYFGTNNQANIEFLKWYTQMCHSINPHAYLVAEVWAGKSTVAPYYASGLDSLFNFDLSDGGGEIVKAVNKGDATNLVKYLSQYEPEIRKLNPQALDAIYLSNHDQGRSAGFFPNLEKNKLAEAIYLWLPGRPYIYYGEEVGLKGSGRDENKRTFMPWDKSTKVKNPENTDYDPKKQVTTTVAQAQADKDSLYNYISQLVAVRNEFPFLQYADFKAWKNDNPAVMAYRAVADPKAQLSTDSTGSPDSQKTAADNLNAKTSEAVIFHNLGKEPQEISLPKGHRLVKAMDKDDTVKDGKLHLEPLSSAFTVPDSTGK